MDVVAAAAQAWLLHGMLAAFVFGVSIPDHTQAAVESQPCDERWLACRLSAVAADLQAITHVSSSSKSSPETALVSKMVTRPGDRAYKWANVSDNIPFEFDLFHDGGWE